jgi:hypothetical protein
MLQQRYYNATSGRVGNGVGEGVGKGVGCGVGTCVGEGDGEGVGCVELATSRGSRIYSENNERGRMYE